MSIREQLERFRPAAGFVPGASGPVQDEDAYFALRTRVHKRLLERVDLVALEAMPPERVKSDLGQLVQRLLEEEPVAINAAERKQVIVDIQHEVLGLGPLEPLLADHTVSEIMVNGPKQVYIERLGKLHLTNVRFGSNAHLLKIIDRIVSAVGRRIDESSPMVDARLADGSRVNAVIPPLALDGPALSIRRFAVVPLKMEDLMKLKTLTPQLAELLDGMVKAKLNLLISGGTGSGKTTFLNILSGYIPQTERIVTIEDAAELQLQQPHVVRLETRPPNVEGKGEVTQRALMRNSLRMRPDRIIVGEVRGGEVLDMLQAMNTGHEGSMTTVHANSARDALTRLESMVGMSGISLATKAMRYQISAALTAVVQIARMGDGSRRLVSVQELTGMEGEIITMQEIFSYERTGVDVDGRVLGRFRATGVRPKFINRLKTFGIKVREQMFDPSWIFE